MEFRGRYWDQIGTAGLSLPAGYPEPAPAGGEVERTDERTGDCQAAAARVEAGLCSVASAGASGAGEASQG
jgi:hypothetical protein